MRALSGLLTFILVLFLFVPACDDGGGTSLAGGDEPGPGSGCNSNVDCEMGYYCSGSSCVEGGIDGTGSECDSNSDCPVNQFCGQNGKCTELQTEDTQLISLDTQQLAFGQVNLEEEGSLKVIVTNTGNQVVNLADPLPEHWKEAPETNPFSIDPDFKGHSIQPGTQYPIEFLFKPETAGEFQAIYILKNDSENAPDIEITLTGEGFQEVNPADFYKSRESIDFGEVSVGRVSPDLVSVGNDGDTGTIELILVEIESETLGGSSAFTVVPKPYREVTPLNPIILEPNTGTVAFQVTFSPYAQVEYTDKILFSFRAQGATNVSIAEVPLTGTGVNGDLIIRPNPISFGNVTRGDFKNINVMIANNSDAPINIPLIRLEGLDEAVGDNVFTFPEGPIIGHTIEVGDGLNFSLRFSPNQEESYAGEMVVDVQGSLAYRIPVTATGIPQGKPPIARVSLNPNEAPITDTVTSEQGLTVKLYGGISEDPDGNSEALRFTWTLNRPDGSSATLYKGYDTEGGFPTTEGSMVSLTLDATGTFTPRLTVHDADGLSSTPYPVTIVALGDNQVAQVTMEFTGEGPTNVDMTWVLPNGVRCERTRLMDGYCPVTTGSGSVMMSVVNAFSDGNKETVTHMNPPDGDYYVIVHYVEDCTDPLAGLNMGGCPLGIGRISTEVTVKFYDNDLDVDRFVFNTSVDIDEANSDGSIRQWTWTRLNGNWLTPVADVPDL